MLFSISTPAVSDQNTYREFGQDYKQELGSESKNTVRQHLLKHITTAH
jgi:hypothetical protein